VWIHPLELIIGKVNSRVIESMDSDKYIHHTKYGHATLPDTVYVANSSQVLEVVLDWPDLVLVCGLAS